MSKIQSRINLETFSLDNLLEKSIKTNALGGKSVAISYLHESGKEPENIIVQTPRMMTFGIDNYNNSSYSITFSFLGMENNESLKQFYSFLNKLDIWGKETALKNSWEWLGTKNITESIIQNNYYNNIKVPSDPNKPSFCKFKLKKSANGFTTAFYNKDKVPIENNEIESNLNKGSYVRALLECNGFWVTDGKLGISWKIKQMLVEPRVDLSREYAFTE